MRLPKSWSNGSAEDKTSRGKAVSMSWWRPSDISGEDTYESGLAATKRVLDTLANP